jgi:hypothetical protein
VNSGALGVAVVVATSCVSAFDPLPTDPCTQDVPASSHVCADRNDVDECSAPADGGPQDCFSPGASLRHSCTCPRGTSCQTWAEDSALVVGCQ